MIGLSEQVQVQGAVGNTAAVQGDSPQDQVVQHPVRQLIMMFASG